MPLFGFCNYDFNSLGQQGMWVLYKQMYYVLQHVTFCGEFENFIHFPTWSYDEVCQLLVHDIIYM
jgi:hypothetical protein